MSITAEARHVEPVTDEQIKSVRTESAVAGDLAQVAICDRAIDGDEAARAECERAIVDAAAQR